MEGREFNPHPMLMEIFIPGNVPSSKNSRVWTGRFLVGSKSTQKYVKETEMIYFSLAKKFRKITNNLQKPLAVEFEFVRDSKRKFDYINPLQTVQDLMVRSGWIDDDSCEYIIPFFKPYRIDKNNPGVYIYIYDSLEKYKKL